MKTVRESAKARETLEGADAQALEHALTITEQERDKFARKLVPAGVMLSLLAAKCNMPQEQLEDMLSSIEVFFKGAKITDEDINDKMKAFLKEIFDA